MEGNLKSDKSNKRSKWSRPPSLGRGNSTISVGDKCPSCFPGKQDGHLSPTEFAEIILEPASKLCPKPYGALLPYTHGGCAKERGPVAVPSPWPNDGGPEADPREKEVLTALKMSKLLLPLPSLAK